jgi:hypothetical protein
LAVDGLRFCPWEYRDIATFVTLVKQEELPLLVGQVRVVGHTDLDGDLILELSLGESGDVPAPIGLEQEATILADLLLPVVITVSSSAPGSNTPDP